MSRFPRRLSLGIACAFAFAPLFAADAVSPTQPTKIEHFKGKVVPLADLVAQAGSRLDADAAPHWLALSCDDGKIYPLIKDSGARLFFKDSALLNRPVRLTGRLLPGSQLLQVTAVHGIEKGQLHEVYYWCDICAIRRGEKNECECCGGPMRLVIEPAAAEKPDRALLSLSLRRRIETRPGSGRFHTLVQPARWDAGKTAVVVCDMWDTHHCKRAALRVGEVAPRMNRFLNEARSRGVLIIHAPSECMDAYKNHPARRNALRTPRAAQLPKDIGQWCRSIPAEEKGVYPIDQSDGGEDDEPAEHRAWAEHLRKIGRNPRAPWKSQIDVLKIEDRDIISDKGEEIWSILQERGIDNVILLGVHTNMCVLGRPFGLRQMTKNGKNVVLVRDLTDTMYNPARAPFVSHFTGTDLIVEHVEKWVCPTITSDQLLGGKPFRFAADKRPHLAIVMAESEYDTNRTLPEFARKHLGRSFRVSLVFASEKDAHAIPGIEVLNDADIALISVRRRALPKEQMALVRRFVSAGKPLVGIRTASHAFSLHGQKPPPGCATWEEFDRDVFGGHYTNHHGEGPQVGVRIAEGKASHPIFEGVDVSTLRGHGSLYKVSPLRQTAVPLLVGSIPDKPAEPVLWAHATPAGGRVVYTSLGHPGDFRQPAFNCLLRNALHWAAGIRVQ